jgi:7,8-dihydropterin-6-yl-methyl-4-(beta-D-ribofuranosyl)aminobenzene 5'-phosphate synthase
VRLSVLVDNNTLTDRYFLGEPGLSFLLEADGARILFDAGYSDAFLRNAAKMGQDLLHLDWIALSHGHLDHSWGLIPLAALFTEALIEGQNRRVPVLAAHPAAMAPRTNPAAGPIGSLLDKPRIEEHFPVELSAEPRRLTDSVWLLGEVPRLLDFEQFQTKEVRRTPDGEVLDHVPDDTGLAVETSRGLVVVSGCAHAGICNTVEHARAVTGVSRVRGVIGGMHLLDAPAPRLLATADHLEALDLELLAPCHCTDLAAKIAVSQAADLTEIGSGLQLHLD